MTLRRGSVVVVVLSAIGLVVGLLVLGLGRAPSLGRGSPLVGTAAPALQGRTLDGNHFRLAHSPGHLTVVNIWASWCGPCRAELPQVSDLTRAWSPRGVRFVTVDTRDGPVAARTLLREIGVRGLLAVQDPSGRIAVSWGATGVPETFLVDSGGVIRAHQSGPVTSTWLGGQLQRWSQKESS